MFCAVLTLMIFNLIIIVFQVYFFTFLSLEQCFSILIKILIIHLTV